MTADDFREIAEFPIRNDKDVKAAAQRARLLATLVGLSDRQRMKLGASVRELADNCFRHAGSGSVAFGLHRSTRQDCRLRVTVTDDKPTTGFEQIDAIIRMQEGPDTGLRRAAAGVSELHIERTADVKQLIAGLQLDDFEMPDNIFIAEWTGILRDRRTRSAVAGSQRAARRLAEELATLQQQRTELEADLEQSRSVNETLTLLSLVASRTDNAVIIMDQHGHVTWVNEAFVRITGYAQQDAENVRPDALLGGPDTSREALKDIARAFEEGFGATVEFLQYQKEGKTGWLSLNLTPVPGADGRISRWIAIGADVSTRKEAEIAVKTARDAAQTASRLKGEFLANISHEIRTPMNAIIGMTDLTLQSELDDEQFEYLSTVKRSAESLLELLNDVLDLSRIESGRLEINPEPISLTDTLNAALKPLKFVAERKGLVFGVHVASDVPDDVIADPLRFRQVLVNLVGNAIKFTDVGRVDVAVEKQWQTDVASGSESHVAEIGLQVTVADTGIGIPADKLNRIFEAFTQADATITRQFGGTGLGLSISSELLRLMHGRIWVQSTPGEGSQFHFSLRCRLANQQQAGQLAERRRQQQRLAQVGSDTPITEPLTILIADDHPANRQLAAAILRKCGHNILEARNGHEVLVMFDSSPPDLILMDVQMPGMGGFECTTAIRERERDLQTHVPIIAVTAHAMRGYREECLAAGMDSYLSKPLVAAELFTLVDSLRDNEVNTSVAAVTSTGFVDDAADPEFESSDRVTLTLAATSQDDQSPADEQPQQILPQSSPEMQTANPFAAALARMDNDDELLKEQMQFFLDDGPRLLQMIEEAAEPDAAATIQIAAHRLKNLCATFDDNEAAQACSLLEHAAASGQVANSQCDSVRQAVSSLLGHVKRFLEPR